VSADYANTTVDLRFGPCTRNQCVAIPLMNDLVPEAPEHFTVKVATITPLPGIVLTPVTATVFISDDDVTLGFEHGPWPYIVSEHIGSLKVCVQVKDGVPQSVLHLSLTTLDGTATGNHVAL